MSKRALLFLVLVAGCGDEQDPYVRPPVDRNGECPEPTRVARTGEPEPLGADGVLYEDGGENVYLPIEARRAPVPSITALAARGDTLVMARLFRSGANLYNGGAEIVTLPTNRAAGRCSVVKRWSSAKDGLPIDRIKLEGDEAMFLDAGRPSAFALSGGDAKPLLPDNDTLVGAFVADPSSVVAVRNNFATGQKLEVLFAGREGAVSGPFRLLGTFDGVATTRMIASDVRHAWIGSGLRSSVLTVDKETRIVDDSALPSQWARCSELASAEGTLWGLCDRDLVRRDASGKSEVVRHIGVRPSGLVADARRAFWAERDSDSDPRMRVYAVDATAPRDANEYAEATTVVDLPDGRNVALARDGDALYLAIETGGCTRMGTVGSGKGVHQDCVADEIAVRVERRSFPR